jgi:hypothetical protein
MLGGILLRGDELLQMSLSQPQVTTWRAKVFM